MDVWDSRVGGVHKTTPFNCLVELSSRSNLVVCWFAKQKSDKARLCVAGGFSPESHRGHGFQVVLGSCCWVLVKNGLLCLASSQPSLWFGQYKAVEALRV